MYSVNAAIYMLLSFCSQGQLHRGEFMKSDNGMSMNIMGCQEQINVLVYMIKGRIRGLMIIC